MTGQMRASIMTQQQGAGPFVVIIGDSRCAHAVALAVAARLAAAGRAPGVLVPPLRGRDFTGPACRRAAGQWCAVHLGPGERPVLVALAAGGLAVGSVSARPGLAVESLIAPSAPRHAAPAVAQAAHAPAAPAPEASPGVVTTLGQFGTPGQPTPEVTMPGGGSAGGVS